MKLRKTVLVRETVHSDGGRETARVVTRAAGVAIIANPHSGAYVHDLTDMFDIGAEIAQCLMPQVLPLLPGPAIAYGKAAIVGVGGELEHAAAVLHPKMGKPIRAAIGGGEAIIPSTSKVASAGASIDVPLGHKDNVWSFDEIDTMTVTVADAPRPDEIAVIIVLSDGPRPHARVGKGRVV